MSLILIFLLWYLLYIGLATIGATFGLHEYWSHGRGKRRVWWEWLSLTCALFIGVYKPVGWIGIHRLHHRYHDTENDPHSPKHKGWKVLLSDWSDTKIPPRIVKDILRNPRIMFFQKYGIYMFIPIAIISLPTVIMGYVGMGVLNYFGHDNGKAVNRRFINFFAPFEGRHADHHGLQAL